MTSTSETQSETTSDLLGVWRLTPGELSLRQIWARPLPHRSASAIDRFLLRLVVVLSRRRVVAVEGLEHIAPELDPFVFALNHNQKPEAVVVPGIVIYARGGRGVHFLSDWMFQLIPFVSTLIRRSGVITLTHKPARPRILNLLKPLWHDPVPALTRARRAIEAGKSIGVFPEGTVNRNPRQLLAGSPGAARLSLETGAPVVPAGIRFPDWPADRMISDRARLLMTIGPPLRPPTLAKPGRPSPEEVRAWHAAVMTEIARLSGKSWEPIGARSR